MKGLLIGALEQHDAGNGVWLPAQPQAVHLRDREASVWAIRPKRVTSGASWMHQQTRNKPPSLKIAEEVMRHFERTAEDPEKRRARGQRAQTQPMVVLAALVWIFSLGLIGFGSQVEISGSLSLTFSAGIDSDGIAIGALEQHDAGNGVWLPAQPQAVHLRDREAYVWAIRPKRVTSGASPILSAGTLILRA